MDFVAFAKANGVLIPRLNDDGEIHRVPTVDHPRSRNGAYKFNGATGWVQAWDRSEQINFYGEPVKEFVQPQQKNEARQAYSEAAKRATEVVGRCSYGPHRYFALKGLYDALGLIDIDGRLVVPMRDHRSGDIQSLQWVTEDGAKRFMTGGRAKGATFTIGPRTAPPWLVEGYATGLTVAAALKQMYRQDRVVVCFSAGNLSHVASQIGGRVIADNDKSQTGQKAAAATGLPWVMSPVEGEDINDLYQRAGIQAVAKLMRSVMT